MASEEIEIAATNPKTGKPFNCKGTLESGVMEMGKGHYPFVDLSGGAAVVTLSHQRAELAMASAMRKVGFTDARATPGGPDGRIDVLSSRAIAQVKMHKSLVGCPDLQRLYGARGSDQP